MCCGGEKNQTPREVFEACGKAGKAVRDGAVMGIGVFVIPAPDLGILESRVVHVADLSYAECMKRGANCEAFQWIATGVEYADGKKGVFRIDSVDDLKDWAGLCDESCRGGCPFGCVCFSGDVNCRSNH